MITGQVAQHGAAASRHPAARLAKAAPKRIYTRRGASISTPRDPFNQGSLICANIHDTRRGQLVVNEPPLPGRELFDASALAEGESARFGPVGASLLALRHAGKLHVYANCCPHQGTELDWLPGKFLDPEGRFIQCATHGALFRIEDGLCLAGPCIGQRLQRARVRLQGERVFAREHPDGT